MVATTKPNDKKIKKEDKSILGYGNENKYKKNIAALEKRNHYKIYDDMEEDYSRNEVRSHKTSGQTKNKIQADIQYDKYEAMKRLEREKKAMQKKYIEDEYEKHRRPMKQRKNTKTNWTKHYEYGMLDDDYIDY